MRFQIATIIYYIIIWAIVHINCRVLLLLKHKNITAVIATSVVSMRIKLFLLFNILKWVASQVFLVFVLFNFLFHSNCYFAQIHISITEASFKATTLLLLWTRKVIKRNVSPLKGKQEELESMDDFSPGVKLFRRLGDALIIRTKLERCIKTTLFCLYFEAVDEKSELFAFVHCQSRSKHVFRYTNEPVLKLIGSNK